MRAKVILRRWSQVSQELGTNDEHMISSVLFSIEIGDNVYNDLTVDIKQTVGSNYLTDPIEVGQPRDYNGPFNHDAFRREVEDYHRNRLRGLVKGIETGGGRWRFQNNTFETDSVFYMDVD